MPEQVKAFGVETRFGPVRAALGGKGLLAASLWGGGAERLERILARRAKGLAIVAVDPLSLAEGRLLAAYLAGRGKDLKTRLDLSGLPDFTARVLRVVAAIPYGQTKSYGEVARLAGSPRAARAVGQVMHNNPLPLFVPCHRVVGSDGSLVGFGSGLANKSAILDMEAGGQPLA